jgi:hypothetical protein
MSNGFSTFPTLEDHSRFLAEFRTEHPAIAEHFTSSRLHPRLIVEAVTDVQLQTVLRAVEGRAEWHGDVQFHPYRT